MTTNTLPTSLNFIDTAPLTERFNMLMAAILSLITAGQMAEVLRLTHKVNRVISLGHKLEVHNILLRRKLDMLTHKPWRDLVIKELGGMKKLAMWEAAQQRITQRKIKPNPSKPAQPAWLTTPERIAESERLKRHVRKCACACVSPNVVRDHVRVDFNGFFRLAPLPRGERAARQITIYTANSICEYDFNAMPLAQEKGFGPATVWPAEFRAAIKIENEIIQARSEDTAKAASPINIENICPIPILPLKTAIDYKAYRDLFHDPFELPG